VSNLNLTEEDMALIRGGLEALRREVHKIIDDCPDPAYFGARLAIHQEEAEKIAELSERIKEHMKAIKPTLTNK